MGGCARTMLQAARNEPRPGKWNYHKIENLGLQVKPENVRFESLLP